ncbi:MAG TPA: hypothetical protein DIT07_11545 [Sphingobacteriaceae bacterium]|nr:hypothetical protein [Sphingobacteriaceae bacterium]
MKYKIFYYYSFVFKTVLLFSVTILIGTNLLAIQKGPLGQLIPVHTQFQSNTITLSAGGQKIEFNGKLVKLNSPSKLDAKWTLSEGKFTNFFLNITSHSASLLKDITWFAGEWEPGVEKVIQSTELMDNVLFLRKGDISFFISIDFPYSKINSKGISYAPYDSIFEDEIYSAHSLSIGACRLSGQLVGKFDRAEIEAVSTYIEQRFPVRFERPMFLSSSITNRMTDVRDGRIFYSMYDNPTLALHPDLVKEDLQLCAKTGIEYYQVFEGVFDWPDKEKTGASLLKLQNEARNLHVRMGDYAVPQGLYCPHFNYEHRSLNHREWMIVDSNGTTTGQECLASSEYEKILTQTLVAHNRKYALQMICLDFLNIKPCYAKNHGHQPGDVYKQICALVQLMKKLNALSPNFLIWSNSGNWLQLMPKLTWYNQNVYLTDPHIRAYEPHLNVLKILGDGRREQMVTVHESYFVPYRTFTNFEYYLAPRSRLSDTKVFEYSFLQGIAVTPNIGFGELRTFLNGIPSKDAEKSVAFIRHWLKFLRDNFNVWKNTLRVGDLPGIGAAEVYAHILNNHGFLVLVNQNSFSRTTTFELNGSIGLKTGKAFTLNEIFPNVCPIGEQQLPFSKRGDSITCIMPANSVRIIEVKAVSDTELPQIFGLPSKVKRLSDGYRFTLDAPQGKKEDIGLVLPAGEAVNKLTISQTPTVAMYTFPVSARILSQIGNLARIEIQFPREKAPYELTHWTVSPGNIEVNLPSLDHTRFLGALVFNAFTENYQVQLDVHTKATNRTNSRIAPNSSLKITHIILPKGENITYTNHFILPFIERYGEDRKSTDDAFIELAFADPSQVIAIGAKLNGKSVAVKRYRNPKQPSFFTYYIELAGNVSPGEVELSLNVQYLKTK